tara:strand:+ start:403 stop:948 length:546 start_codon:yes stop_codon:yes gene_type:complete
MTTFEKGKQGETFAQVVNTKVFKRTLVQETEGNRADYDHLYLDGFKFIKEEVKTDLPALHTHKAFPLEVGSSNTKDYLDYPTIKSPNEITLAKTGILASTADELFLTDTESFFSIEMWRIKEYIRDNWDKVKHFKGTKYAYGLTISVDVLKTMTTKYHLSKNNPITDKHKALFKSFTEAKA